GATRNFDDRLVAAAPMHAAALAVRPSVPHNVRVKTQVQQRLDLLIRHKNDVAPVPTVAAIGPAIGHIFFPQEGAATIAAGASGKLHPNAINKHGMSSK